MKRTAGTLVLLSALSGCSSMGDVDPGAAAGPPQGCYAGGGTPPMVPGVQGAWGQPVPVAAPYNAVPINPNAARAMLSQSVPLSMVQGQSAGMPGSASGIMQAGATGYAGMPSGVIPAQAACPPGGCPPELMMPRNAISPPGLPYAPGMQQGPMPPGMMPMPGQIPPGAVAAVGALTPMSNQFASKRTEVRFGGPTGMKVNWFVQGPDGKAEISRTPITAPGRYNFNQAAIYRLKLSDIPNRPGLELYPTLEVVPCNAKTDSFLAHSAVPVSFTDYDFEQIASGNYLVKVVYLPDPRLQDLATTGPNEVVSNPLEPGVDPIAEALRRGSILLVIRMGNIDLEAPNTPAMDAPNPFLKPHGPPMGMMPPMPPGGMGTGMAGPGPMVPYGAMSSGQPGPGQVIMGPNGPMIMGPNGPMPIPQGAHGPAMLPPPNYGKPPTGPAATPTTPTSVPSIKAADKPATQPIRYLGPLDGASSSTPKPNQDNMPQERPGADRVIQSKTIMDKPAPDKVVQVKSSADKTAADQGDTGTAAPKPTALQRIWGKLTGK